MVPIRVVDADVPVGGAYKGLFFVGAVAAVIWLFASALIASHDRDHALADALLSETRQIEQSGESIASGIRRILSLRTGIAATFAEDPSIRQLMLKMGVGASPASNGQGRGSTPRDLDQLNRFLVHAKKHLGVGGLWIGDASGNGLAADSAGTSESPVGVNFADRAYFREAKAGRLGHQFAIGKTTNIAGLYFSAPIKDGNRFLGFFAVKIDLLALSVWVDQADAFLTDSNGVIVLAKDKGLEMRALADAPVRQLTAAVRQNRYHKTEFAELLIAPWGDQRLASLQRLNRRDAPALLRSYPLPEYDLNLVVTRPFPQLALLERQRDVNFAFLAGIGTLLIIGLTGSAAYLRYVHYSRQAMRRQKQQLEEAQRLARAGSWQINLIRQTVTWSNACRLIFEVPSAESESSCQVLLDAIHPDDLELVVNAYRESVAKRIPGEVSHRIRLSNGQIRFVHEHWETYYDASGKPLRSLGSVQDITERTQMEDQVRQMAFHDALTKLPNRRLLNDRLSQTMAASKRGGRYGALMFLDLDNFKLLNDTHGHNTGDLLLLEVADRLKRCVREIDTVSRFGGDEFVVLLSDLNADKAESTAQASFVAEKIRIALQEPYWLTIRHEGRADSTVEHRCTASIGVVVFIDHEGSQDDLLKWADAAMYQAKELGRNRVRFHYPGV